jgi:signal transduction histidine kinase
MQLFSLKHGLRIADTSKNNQIVVIFDPQCSFVINGIIQTSPMKSYFNKLSIRLIHPAIQSDELTFTKAKTLLILLLFFLFVLTSYTALFALNNVLFNIKALLNYSGILVVVLSLFLLKKAKNLKHPLRIINYSSVILITGGVYWSGGFASNDILWYIVSAVSSLLFIGQIDGIIMTIYSLLAIFSFYLIDVMNLVEFPYDELTRSIHYRFSNAVTIILILFFLMWVLVNRNRRLNALIHDIQNTQVRESISQDFHDELGNKLASVVHLSKRLNDSKNSIENTEMLEVIEKEAQDVYENFRDFVWANDPDSLNSTSLFVYLTDFNQQFFTQKDINVEGQFLSEKDSSDIMISSHVVQNLVPLFKELMTNIYKHAEANQVNWSLQFSKRELILSIQDDGVGFDVHSVKSGQGLKNINKRAGRIDAKIHFNSHDSGGTSVTLNIDINNKTNADV